MSADAAVENGIELRQLVPELPQADVVPERLAREIMRWLEYPNVVRGTKTVLPAPQDAPPECESRCGGSDRGARRG